MIGAREAFAALLTVAVGVALFFGWVAATVYGAGAMSEMLGGSSESMAASVIGLVTVQMLLPAAVFARREIGQGRHL